MDDTWPNRFYIARKTLDLRSGKDVPDVEFGARVAQRLGRRPYGSGSVSQWRTMKQIPPSGVQLAIALECGVDPGWLSYGHLSGAPVPALVSSIDVGSLAEALPQPKAQQAARQQAPRRLRREAGRDAEVRQARKKAARRKKAR